MLRVAFKSLLARKLRLLMSTAAIVLGVGFVAGSLIFTDAMSGAFDDIIEGSTADAEVGFRGANDFDSLPDSRVLPAALVDELEALPEVASAHPQNVLQTVFVIDKDGKVVGGNGPPGLAFNPTDAISLTGKPVMKLASGELPDAPFEIALGEDTAERAGYRIGDSVTLATSGTPPTLKAKLTGLVDSGTSTVGATITVFDTAFLQKYFFGGRNVFTSISLNAAEGISQRELADAAQKVLPKGVEARTGDAVVERNQNVLDEVLGFLQTFLLVFAAVSLVVGTFLIINTFSILVAQRSRELALLRALGASRRQVNFSVMVEALIVGVIGSTVGIGVGYLLAQLLRVFFGQFGLDLSGATFPIQAATVAWSYAVGIVVTMVASILPALRASRIAPMAALRDDVALPESTLRRRVLVGSFLVVLGVGGMVLGFLGEGSTGLLLIGLGILLVLIGVALMSPFLGQPILRAFGALYRRTHGAVGALAGGNVLRNPRRTSATASALMIGLTLMTMMSIFGASASASTDEAIGKSLTSQYIISNVVQVPFSTSVAKDVARLDGVAGVAQLHTAYPEVNGADFQLAIAMAPRQIPTAFDLAAREGSFADLAPGTVALTTAQAKARHVGVGDTLTMKLQAGEQKLRVVATFQPGLLPGDYLVTPDTLVKGGLAPLDSLVYVTKEPDADTDQVRAAIEKVIQGLPTVTVKDPEGYADEQKGQINQFLYMIYGLLGLSVVIAILGVVNTLGLSVIERTREIGLLRAVGLSRRQLRTMIRLESIVVVIFGAVLGLVMGLAFGAAIVTALEDQGLSRLAVPWLWLVAFLLIAVVVGVLAAVFPARRAARLDVLEAIAAE
jgi:putative ABC transport system permease protein